MVSDLHLGIVDQCLRLRTGGDGLKTSRWHGEKEYGELTFTLPSHGG